MGKKLVLPGEFLSTEEEFVPGKNAFDSDGNLYSGSLGHVEEDNKTKEISVKPVIPLQMLRPGSIVFGRVSFVKENMVSVSLGKNPKDMRQIVAPTSAMLPVRNVSHEYVESLRGCFRIGDIIRAKVAKVFPAGIDLATDHPDLGVIEAFCSRCRQPLHIFGHSLKCMSCGHTEVRKLASGYLVK